MVRVFILLCFFLCSAPNIAHSLQPVYRNITTPILKVTYAPNMDLASGHALILAMTTWNQFLEKPIFVLVSEKDDWDIMVVPNYINTEPILAFVHPLAGNKSLLIISRGYQDNVQVIVHELGHCLGLLHSDDPTSIMFWAVGDNQELKEETKESLRYLVSPSLSNP